MSPRCGDANEPLYAQPPAEYVRGLNSDLWTPTWNEKPYFAHAPLATWLTIPAYHVFGVTPFAERLVMALAALGAILATGVLARRLGAATQTAVLAALVLAATPRVWLFARQLSGDMLLLACLMAAFAALAPVLDPKTTVRAARRAVTWAAMWIGIGALAKGPVIYALFLPPVGLAWLVARRPVPFSAFHAWRFAWVSLLLAAPWSVAMAVQHPDFLRLHYGWYHGARLIGGIGRRGLCFYPVALAGEALPWWPLLLLLWGRRRTSTWLAAGRALPWVAVLWIVLLFTLPAGKRNVYVLPVYPFLALLLAPALQAGLGRLARPTACVVAATAGLAAWMLLRWAQHAPLLQPEALWLAGGVGGGGLLLATWLDRRPDRAVGVGLCALLLLLVGIAATFPALDRYKPVPKLADQLRALDRLDASMGRDPLPAIIYAVPIHSLNFYLGRSTEVARTYEELDARLDPKRGGYVLTAGRFVDRVVGTGRRAARTRALHLDALQRGWVHQEVARAPETYFRFDRSVLGKASTLRDLVLLRVARVSAGPGEDAGSDPR